MRGGRAKGQDSGVTPECPDLSIVSPECAFERRYKVYVGNPGTGDGEDSCYLLGFFFNCCWAGHQSRRESNTNLSRKI